jgi:hypothetical protein
MERAEQIAKRNESIKLNKPPIDELAGTNMFKNIK